MAGPTWTATNGGLIGGGIGLVGGAGIGYAIGRPATAAPAAPVSKARSRRPAHPRENPATMVATSVGSLLGVAIGGLVGAMLGKRSQFNAWTVASQACPQTQIADWATFQCSNMCPDDSAPVNGQCVGYVPKAGLLGAPKNAGVGRPMGLPGLSPRGTGLALTPQQTAYVASELQRRGPGTHMIQLPSGATSPPITPGPKGTCLYCTTDSNGKIVCVTQPCNVAGSAAGGGTQIQ
jgi:hypothetical protein